MQLTTLLDTFLHCSLCFDQSFRWHSLEQQDASAHRAHVFSDALVRLHFYRAKRNQTMALLSSNHPRHFFKPVCIQKVAKVVHGNRSGSDCTQSDARLSIILLATHTHTQTCTLSLATAHLKKQTDNPSKQQPACYFKQRKTHMNTAKQTRSEGCTSCFPCHTYTIYRNCQFGTCFVSVIHRIFHRQAHRNNSS